MEFIDTHTHTYDEAFAGCEDEVIGRAVAAGVSTMLQADVDSAERGRMLELTARHPGTLRHMIGLYPGSVRENWRYEIEALEAAYTPDAVAVGEIGLDYHYGREFASEQKEALRVQLELAAGWDLPVNIHLREAAGDFLEIIEDCRHLHLRGNLHAFSGSWETFSRLSRCGDWYIGVGGVVTFRKASIAEELRKFPLDRILLETDAPYLTPVPHRGERNESAYIPLIAAEVARRTGRELEEVAEATTANARKLFAI